jgi:hypothetical protein
MCFLAHEFAHELNLVPADNDPSDPWLSDQLSHANTDTILSNCKDDLKQLPGVVGGDPF